MKQSAQNPADEKLEWLPGFVAPAAACMAVASGLIALVTLFLPQLLPGEPGWPEGLLLLALTVMSVSRLVIQLPLQNVLLAASVTALIGGIAHAVGAATAIPFGPFTFTNNTGPAWPMPLIWIVAILNSRGVARLILRPWRKLQTYGFWVIGVTATLTVLFSLAFDPFASRVKRYWLWSPTNLPVTWHGAPLTNFPAWLAVSLLILAFITPPLISKNPRKLPPDYWPLGVWVSLLGIFAVGEATLELWSAVIFCAVSALVVSAAAIRGAK